MTAKQGWRVRNLRETYHTLGVSLMDLASPKPSASKDIRHGFLNRFDTRIVIWQSLGIMRCYLKYSSCTNPNSILRLKLGYALGGRHTRKPYEWMIRESPYPNGGSLGDYFSSHGAEGPWSCELDLLNSWRCQPFSCILLIYIYCHVPAGSQLVYPKWQRARLASADVQMSQLRERHNNK